MALSPIQAAGMKPIVSMVDGWCRATNRSINTASDLEGLTAEKLIKPLELAIKKIKEVANAR